MSKFVLVSKGAITKKAGITYGILFVVEALLLLLSDLVDLSRPAHSLSLFFAVLFLIQAFGCFLRRQWTRWLAVILGVATVLMSIFVFIAQGQLNFIGFFLGYIFIRYASLDDTIESKNPIFSGKEFSRESIRNWLILIGILLIPIILLIVFLS